jgi:hypothetical protein
MVQRRHSGVSPTSHRSPTGCRCGRWAWVQRQGVDDAQKVTALGLAYELFNDHSFDQLLALMVDDVLWPDVAAGAVPVGRPAIGQYWAAKFAVTNPRVLPRVLVNVEDQVFVIVEPRISDLRSRRCAHSGAGDGVPPVHVPRRPDQSHGFPRDSRVGRGAPPKLISGTAASASRMVRSRLVAHHGYQVAEGDVDIDEVETPRG